MKKQRKMTYVKPEMEFNPAIMNYEPSLPLKKSKAEVKFKIDWKWIIIGIIILIIFLLLILENS